MRSKSMKFRLPLALEESVGGRVGELTYENLSEYVLGLIRYDLTTRKPHPVTGDIARLPRAEQDKIDDEIARTFAAGESLGGSWFAHRIEDAIAASKMIESETPKIVRALVRGIADKKPKK